MSGDGDAATRLTPDQVELTVNGVAVTVDHGATILDALRRLGVETPTICYASTTRAKGSRTWNWFTHASNPVSFS